jgi:hypothetical protein
MNTIPLPAGTTTVCEYGPAGVWTSRGFRNTGVAGRAFEVDDMTDSPSGGRRIVAILRPLAAGVDAAIAAGEPP